MKRIFIVGHGCIINDVYEEISECVNGFVESGGFFTHYLAPGIIQALVQGFGNSGFSINDLLDKEGNDSGQKQTTITRSVNKHLLFLEEDDGYPEYTKGNRKGSCYCNLCNKGCIDSRYYFTKNENGIKSPFKSAAEQENGKFEYHLGNPEYTYNNKSDNTPDSEKKLSNDDILVYPKIKGAPTSNNQGAYPSLGEIITFFKERFPNDGLEFYWLACRQNI